MKAETEEKGTNEKRVEAGDPEPTSQTRGKIPPAKTRPNSLHTSCGGVADVADLLRTWKSPAPPTCQRELEERRQQTSLRVEQTENWRHLLTVRSACPRRPAASRFGKTQLQADDYTTAGLDTWFMKTTRSTSTPPKHRSSNRGNAAGDSSLPAVLPAQQRGGPRLCISTKTKTKTKTKTIRRTLPRERQGRTQEAHAPMGSIPTLPDFLQLSLQFCSSHVVSNHFSAGANQHHGW